MRGLAAQGSGGGGLSRAAAEGRSQRLCLGHLLVQRLLQRCRRGRGGSHARAEPPEVREEVGEAFAGGALPPPMTRGREGSRKGLFAPPANRRRPRAFFPRPRREASSAASGPLAPKRLPRELRSRELGQHRSHRRGAPPLGAPPQAPSRLWRRAGAPPTPPWTAPGSARPPERLAPFAGRHASLRQRRTTVSTASLARDRLGRRRGGGRPNQPAVVQPLVPSPCASCCRRAAGSQRAEHRAGRAEEWPPAHRTQQDRGGGRRNGS